jgi:aryl-alcohol dehydrogenase-like predicted oxidoreductase
MDVRTLGEGPSVAAVGLGCMGLSQGYGPTDEGEARRTLSAALDAGVTLFDTAQSYGSGANERLVGAAVGGRAGVTVATKTGIVRDAGGVRLDGRPQSIHAACDDSLRRLGVDAIGLYYLHRVDPAVPLEDSVGALAELVSAGKVHHVGVSEVTPEQLRRAVAVHPVAAVQCEWSLMWREPEDALVPAARRLGVGLVPYSPLGRGLLTATLTGPTARAAAFRQDDPRFAGPALAQNLQRVDALRAVAGQHRATVAQVALAWLLAQGPDVVPIPGSRTPERARENAGAADVRLSGDDLARIDAVAPRDGWAGDRRSFAAVDTTRSR